jgi:DNA-binding NtrC family response regulator
MGSMVRPCFIVMDVEHSGSISTRKLVIESAKLNVITAYTGAEALETLKKYPAVDGMVCNTEVRDMPVRKVVEAAKKMNPKLPIIVIGPEGDTIVEPVYHVRSFDPRRLLDVLQSLLPDKITAIIDHEDEMRDDEARR